MTTVVKIHRKGQTTLPTRLRVMAGIAEGDLVEAAFERGKIIITPKVLVDRSQFPNADDEYTPAQRRVIDTRLAKAEADIKAGRLSPVFATHQELVAHLHKATKKSGAGKTSTRSVR